MEAYLIPKRLQRTNTQLIVLAVQEIKSLILQVLRQRLIAIVIRLKFAIQTVYLANLGGSYLVKSSDLINLPSLMFKDDLSSNKSTQKEP